MVNKSRQTRAFVGIELLLALIVIFAGLAAPFHLAWSTLEGLRLRCTVANYRTMGEPLLPHDLRGSVLKDPDNAVVDLRAAYKLSDDEGKDSRWFFDVDFDRHLSQNTLERVGKYVEARAGAIERLKQARGKRVDWGIDWNSPMALTLLLDLNPQRGLANLLWGAAACEHAKGNDDRAVDCAQLITLQARAIREQPVLVSYLVAAALDSQAQRTLERMLPDLKIGDAPGQVTSAKLKTLIAELLDDRDLSKSWLRALRGERAFQLDAARMIVSGRLGFGGQWQKESQDPTDAILGYLCKPVVFRDVREMIETEQTNIRSPGALDWPTMQQRLSDRSQQIESHGWDQGLHFFRRMITPSLDRAALMMFRNRANRHLLAAAFAVRWYAHDHANKFPASLDELVPAYLPATPTDPFAAGAPKLRYVVRDEKASLYSVNDDGVDEGASQAPSGEKSSSDRWSQKDAVLILTVAR